MEILMEVMKYINDYGYREVKQVSPTQYYTAQTLSFRTIELRGCNETKNYLTIIKQEPRLSTMVENLYIAGKESFAAQFDFTPESIHHCI